MNSVLEMSNDSTHSFLQEQSLRQMQRNHSIKSVSSNKRMSPSLKSSSINMAPGRDPQSHRIIEKRRRDRMNSCLADLSKLIPHHMFNKRGKGRVEKTEIVEMAIKHLKFLTNTIAGLTSSSPTPPAENHSSQSSNLSFHKEKVTNFQPDLVQNESYRLGFKECLSETLRFLVEFEGFSLNQDFVQYPGSQSVTPPQNGDGSIQCAGSGGGGFHLTKLVSHLNTHLDKVVESRLKHPQEMSNEDFWRNQPKICNSFEIKVTTVDNSEIPMDAESGFELRNMLLPDAKKNCFQRHASDEMAIRREMMESPVLSTSSQTKGSYKKEIKDRFLRMRVESVENSASDGMSGNQDRGNMDKPNDGTTGSVSTFFSSASSSSGSSNGSLSSNSSTSSFPVFHPNNRGRSYSMNTYGPLCTARNVIPENQEQKERNMVHSTSSISIFGFALHPSRSYYIPFQSKTSNLHETLTNAMLNECNPNHTNDHSSNVRNMYPVSINVKIDSVPDL